MTVTCIINQFDFKAGTRGDGACILSGKERPANPTIKSEIGLLMEPIMEVLVLDSKNIVVEVIPQAKKNRDSYRLLKGK
jgi:hypothetical protein